ncbi:MAG TPA: RsmG family class I SAM-dependent methyltransferase [Actinomycetota bacterium]|nr:RsmG family class I SAM-dependent methyltransferase [Actinomycetota bacterium]
MFHVKHRADAPARLAVYADLVRRWAPRLDLVSPGDLPRFEERHIADSLKAAAVVDSLPPGTAVDVGSGAGLPGIPLAIAAHPRRWRLLEPRPRKAAFLEECVRVLELDCDVLALTAQEAARRADLLGDHVCALARALAAPAEAFRLLLPLVRADGVAGIFASPDTRLPAEAERVSEGLAIMRGMEEGRSRSGPV